MRRANNFWLNVAESGVANAALAFISTAAVMPLFVAQHTDARWALGAVTAVSMVALQLPQLLGAAHMARAPRLCEAFYRHTLLPRIALALLALVPWLPEPWLLPGFFLALACFWGAMGYNYPAWYVFAQAVVPKDRLGAFFGWRSLVGGVASLAAAGLAGWFLSRFPGPTGFAACFWLAAVGFTTSWGCLARTRVDWEPIERERAAPDALPPLPIWAEALALIQVDAAFRRWITCRVLLTGTAMAAAFPIVLGQARFGLTAGEASWLAIALIHLPGLCGAWAGGLADRHGIHAMLAPAAVAAGLACLGLAIAPTLPAFVACLLVLGAGNVALMIADNKRLMEVGGARVGLACSVFNLALLAPSALFAFAGGLLADLAGVEATLLGAGLTWLAGAALLGRVVPTAFDNPSRRTVA